MYALMDNNFIDWLLIEMGRRKWSQADLARESGLTRQSISDYVNRRRTNPEPGALVSIANALGVDPILVFRKAGLLPPGPENKVRHDDWDYVMSQLDEGEQEEIRAIADLKIKRRKDAESANRKIKPAER
jgi:transcriptional regulator with XRE-family HTH domain